MHHLEYLLKLLHIVLRILITCRPCELKLIHPQEFLDTRYILCILLTHSFPRNKCCDSLGYSLDSLAKLSIRNLSLQGLLSKDS